MAIPKQFNLARYCLARPAKTTPDKTALIVVGDLADGIDRARHWTYGELDLAVRRVAAGLLAEGLAAGDRLLVRLPNDSDYALVFLGAISAGLVPIPVSTQLTESEAAFLLADSAARAIAEIGAPALAAVDRRACMVLDEAAIARLKASPPLADHADTDAEAPAYMVYTSGTIKPAEGRHPRPAIACSAASRCIATGRDSARTT